LPHHPSKNGKKSSRWLANAIKYIFTFVITLQTNNFFREDEKEDQEKGALLLGCESKEMPKPGDEVTIVLSSWLEGDDEPKGRLLTFTMGAEAVLPDVEQAVRCLLVGDSINLILASQGPYSAIEEMITELQLSEDRTAQARKAGDDRSERNEMLGAKVSRGDVSVAETKSGDRIFSNSSSLKEAAPAVGSLLNEVSEAKSQGKSEVKLEDGKSDMDTRKPRLCLRVTLERWRAIPTTAKELSNFLFVDSQRSIDELGKVDVTTKPLSQQHQRQSQQHMGTTTPAALRIVKTFDSIHASEIAFEYTVLQNELDKEAKKLSAINNPKSPALVITKPVVRQVCSPFAKVDYCLPILPVTQSKNTFVPSVLKLASRMRCRFVNCKIVCLFSLRPLMTILVLVLVLVLVLLIALIVGMDSLPPFVFYG
jgi:hypothetical protein